MPALPGLPYEPAQAMLLETAECRETDGLIAGRTGK